MLYEAYQACIDLLRPTRVAAGWSTAAWDPLPPGLAENAALRNFLATCQLLTHTKLSHRRPDFGIKTVNVGNREVAVEEEATYATPFCTLLRFKKDTPTVQPRVLLVSPMSGHFSTLLRGTVRTLLPDQDVYITDWHNARHVGLRHGRFDFDDYVDHLIKFLEVLGPGAHIVAVCQPCVAALAAVALMAEADNPATPRSMTLMAGPIDCRINPTKVNELATSKPIEWFERNLISRVPLRYPGAMRQVYPGFVQLTAFMAMNLDRHIKAHTDLFENIVKGEAEKVAATRTFYDEYFAVADLPAEFYLETVKAVFQDYLLPLGKLVSRGRLVNPRAIRRTALLTVEGEKDDICSVGQTLAAQDLCSSIRPYRKRHHQQAGVGHYGVFNGRRWRTEAYPKVRDFIRANG